MRRLYWIVIIALIVTLAVSACQRATPTPEAEPTTEEETAPPPSETVLPTNPPIPTSTPNTAATDSFPTASGPTTEGLSPEESFAASLVDATYTGYACVITPVGCACEEPILQTINFEFAPEAQRMNYRFAGEGYSSTWEMTRLGPNHWGYTIPWRDEQSGNTGALVVLLTFIDGGFIRTDAGDVNGALVNCPDVNYRRVDE